MLIKCADDHSDDIAQLSALLAEPDLSSSQKKNIQKQLNDLEKGAWGEQRAAYFIDFYFAASENHIVLHDLRLLLTDGRTAQIDHLLINRFQDFYVLESKNWQQLTVDQAGACTTWAGRIIGVESPLEQCRRHADILSVVLQAAPEVKRLAPRYQLLPRVLVAPECHLKAPYHHEWYVKADAFYSVRTKEFEDYTFVENLLDIPRYVSKQTLMKLGQALAGFHHPAQPDWRKRFGINKIAEKIKNPAHPLVISIEGLSEFVPRWGEDWFVLKGEPTDATKKKLKAAGYRAKQEKDEWVWRLKA